MAATEAEIVVNVRLLPEETPTHSHLTRFQRGRLGEVTGPTLRLKCRPSDTVATLKKMILTERGEPVETLRRGGSPKGVPLAPDTATLAECGVTRSMGVWEHLWEDSEANQASFQEEKQKVRGMVTSFMEEFPAVGRGGKAVTGEEDEDEAEGWDEGMKKKRAEMEAAVATEKEKKKKKSALEEAAAAGGAAVEEGKMDAKNKEKGAAPAAAAAAASTNA